MGVVLMSGMQCIMLSEALRENGDALYAAGNFALHYMPLVRAIYCRPTTILNPHKQCTACAAISIAYTLVEVPTHVYGCYVDSSLVVGGFVWIALIQLYVVIPNMSLFFRDSV
jgi:hypothetical protein